MRIRPGFVLVLLMLAMVAVMVGRAAATMNVTISLTSPVNPSVYGQQVVFTVTVDNWTAGVPPTGTVTLFAGSNVVGTATVDYVGVANVPVANLSAASHTMTATYSGDPLYTSSNSPTIVQTVATAATSTNLVAATNPSVFGQAVNFTAAVTVISPGAGLPTGNVDFMDGGTPLGTAAVDATGVATLSVGTLPAGSHASITATYRGDQSFSGSSGNAVAQVVNQASTTTTLSSSQNPSTVGHSVQFTATVLAVAPGSGLPSGTATFFDGVTPLGTSPVDAAGVAVLSTSALTTASHEITVVYNGDANFLASSSLAVTQVVSPLTATAVTLASTANPSTYGIPITLTATATPASGSGTPTGTFTLWDGGVQVGAAPPLDGNGQATFTIVAPGGGNHAYSAEYSGDSDFLAATGTMQQTVSPATTTTTLVANPTRPILYQEVILTATVGSSLAGPLTPSGIVTFRDGSSVLGAVTLNPSGVATWSTTALALGGHTVTATYGGDPNYVSSTSAAVAQTVDMPVTTLAATNVTATVLPSQSAAYGLTFQAQGTPMTTPVVFSALGLPSGATATFNPPSIIPGLTPSTFTLQVQTQAMTSSAGTLGLAPGPGLLLVSLAACLAGLLTLRRNVRALRVAAAVSLAVVLITVAMGATGCGSGSTTSGTTSGATGTGSAVTGTVAPGTYHFTIEGKAGTTTIISQPLTLVVL